MHSFGREIHPHSVVHRIPTGSEHSRQSRASHGDDWPLFRARDDSLSSTWYWWRAQDLCGHFSRCGRLSLIPVCSRRCPRLGRNTVGSIFDSFFKRLGSPAPLKWAFRQLWRKNDVNLNGVSISWWRLATSSRTRWPLVIHLVLLELLLARLPQHDLRSVFMKTC